MPRKQPWPPPVYWHKPRNEDRAVVYQNGRRRHVTLGPHGSEEARAAYRRLLAELEAAGGVAPRPAAALTVGELLDAYEAHAERRAEGARHGKKRMEHIVRADLVAAGLYGPTPARDFGPKALKAVRAAMISRGWTRSYVNLSVGRVRRAFRWAVSEELVTAEQLRQLEAVEDLRKGEEGVREGKKVRPAPEVAVEATLPLLVRQARDLVALVRLTGMRTDEACQLRPADVSTEGRDPSGTLWPGLWTFTPGHHKGDDEIPKVIFLGPRAQRILKPYLDRPADAWCFSPREAVAERYAELGRSYPECSSRGPGAVYTTHTLYTAIRRAAKKAGVAHWHPHQLRHGHATAVRAKYDKDHAKSALGQESDAAAAIYAERDLEKAAKIAREMG